MYVMHVKQFSSDPRTAAAFLAAAVLRVIGKCACEPTTPNTGATFPTSPTAPMHFSLHSQELSPPLGNARRISIIGQAPGQAVLTLDPNERGINPRTGTAATTLRDVQDVRVVLSGAPAVDASLRRFEITGAPWLAWLDVGTDADGVLKATLTVRPPSEPERSVELVTAP